VDHFNSIYNELDNEELVWLWSICICIPTV